MEVQVRLNWTQTTIWEAWKRDHPGQDGDVLTWAVMLALVHECSLALRALYTEEGSLPQAQGAKLHERLDLVKAALGDAGVEVRWNPELQRTQWRTTVMSWENI